MIARILSAVAVVAASVALAITPIHARRRMAQAGESYVRARYEVLKANRRITRRGSASEAADSASSLSAELMLAATAPGPRGDEPVPRGRHR